MIRRRLMGVVGALTVAALTAALPMPSHAGDPSRAGHCCEDKCDCSGCCKACCHSGCEQGKSAPSVVKPQDPGAI